MDIWQVKETPCFPNSWKVYPARVYQETNDTCNFFPTKAEAEAEAELRNKWEDEYEPPEVRGENYCRPAGVASFHRRPFN